MLDPLVKTEYGVVEGKNLELKDGRLVNVFLGIPYAKPPVGELRFQKPQPPEAWKGIYRSKKYRHRPIQNEFPWDPIRLKIGKSEDCLHLNIVAPSWSNPEFPHGFPVMFYIHGGGYVMDSAVKYHYKNIARTLVRHNVVVVTIHYRLGYLGFFCTNDENSPGNYGLWDQLMALQWVKRNIRNFNGDPNRITVFGQSAGAVCADLLSISPLSRDLFDQVILMGGNAESYWAINSKEAVAKHCQKKALKLGFQRLSKGDVWTKEENASMMNYLRSLPPEKLASSVLDDTTMFENMRLALTPVIEGEFLPKSIKKLRKEAKPKNVIVGGCRYEGLLFCMGFLALHLQTVISVNYKFLKFVESKAMSVIQAANQIVPSDRRISVDVWRELYEINDETKRSRKQIGLTCVNVISDIISNIPVYNYCQKMLNNGSTVYSYIFEHFNPDTTRSLSLFLPFHAATHTTELIYLFDISLFVTPFRRTKEDRKVLEEMTRMWTNFAKYGNPNGKWHEITDFEWEPVSEGHIENHLVIRPECKMRETFESERISRQAMVFDAIREHLTQHEQPPETMIESEVHSSDSE